MGTSLNGLTPAGTYPGLIKTGDNAPIDGTLKTLSDGNGNNLPMEASTTGINFTGNVLKNGLPLATPPSGIAGAIQFSNGSAFASDATNLFWDDTNNRLGVGTNVPNHLTEFLGAGMNPPSSITSPVNLLLSSNFSGIGLKLGLGTIQSTQGGGAGTQAFALNINPFGGNTNFGTTTDLGARLGIKGSGSTSATTSLLVQNSAGTAALTVKDDLSSTFGGTLFGTNGVFTANLNFGNILYGNNFWNQSDGGTRIGGGSSAPVASAIFQADSTTKGFLPPRMTTTQKNAIATPATGLVVYDNTTNKLCCYNGSTWNDLF